MVDAVSAPDVAIVPEQIVVATVIPDLASASRARKQMDVAYSVTRPSGEPTLRFHSQVWFRDLICIICMFKMI
jgi:hypothetical protein